MRKRGRRGRQTRKKLVMNKLVLAKFFLVYEAFNPPVYNSLLLKKKLEM